MVVPSTETVMYYVPIMNLRLEKSMLKSRGLSPSSKFVFPLYVNPPTDYNVYEYKCIDTGKLNPVKENNKVIAYEVIYEVVPLDEVQRAEILSRELNISIEKCSSSTQQRIFDGYYYTIDNVEYHFSFGELQQTNLNANLVAFNTYPDYVVEVRGWDAQDNAKVFSMGEAEYLPFARTALDFKSAVLLDFWKFEEEAKKVTSVRDLKSLEEAFLESLLSKKY